MNDINDSLLTGKISLIIAGSLGGMLSLAFIKTLSPIKSFLSIVAGGISAYYATPIIASIYKLDNNIEDSIAFFIGLVAMNITGGIFNLSIIFKKDPVGTLENIIHKHKNDKK